MTVAAESEYRAALYDAQRALMHAEKWLHRPGEQKVRTLVGNALAEVSRVLDMGRDESREQGAT